VGSRDGLETSKRRKISFLGQESTLDLVVPRLVTMFSLLLLCRSHRKLTFVKAFNLLVP
jgi:hypothetical protein